MMKRIFLCLSPIPLSFLLWLAPAHAQEQLDLPSLLDRANKLLAARDFQGALTAAQALSSGIKARFGSDHAHNATAYYTLAAIYCEGGDNAQCEAQFRQALDIIDKNPDQVDVLIVSNTLHNISYLSRVSGKLSDAERFGLRALAFREKAEQHFNVAHTLQNLGNTYVDMMRGSPNQAKLADAERAFQRALQINSNLPDGKLATADNLSGLGNVAVLRRNYTEAVAHFRRALSIREQSHGADGIEIAPALNDLAVAYRDGGQLAEAEQTLVRVLAIYDKASGGGPEHPYVADSLHALSLIQTDRRQFADARRNLVRALAISEKTHGADHSHLAPLLYNMGRIDFAERRDGDAQRSFERALAIYEKQLGRDSPGLVQTLVALETVYRAQGKSTDAARVQARAKALSGGK